MTDSPTLPQKVCEMNKAIVQNTMSNIASVAGIVGRSAARTFDASRTAGKTVVGQTRSATSRTADTIATGVRDVAGEARTAASRSASSIASSAKEVAGQASAQGAHVASVVDRQANHVVDETTRVVSDHPAPGTPYEEWTKRQLLERAREVDLDGRATMNKAELVDALRS